MRNKKISSGYPWRFNISSLEAETLSCMFLCKKEDTSDTWDSVEMPLCWCWLTHSKTSFKSDSSLSSMPDQNNRSTL